MKNITLFSLSLSGATFLSVALALNLTVHAGDGGEATVKGDKNSTSQQSIVINGNANTVTAPSHKNLKEEPTPKKASTINNRNAVPQIVIQVQENTGKDQVINGINFGHIGK